MPSEQRTDLPLAMGWGRDPRKRQQPFRTESKLGLLPVPSPGAFYLPLPFVLPFCSLFIDPHTSEQMGNVLQWMPFSLEQGRRSVWAVGALLHRTISTK